MSGWGRGIRAEENADSSEEQEEHKDTVGTVVSKAPRLMDGTGGDGCEGELLHD